MLEFVTDNFPNEPMLLQIRLCGDHHGAFAPFLHTNIAVTYKQASPSRSTGCLLLISVQSWQDDSPWQTIDFGLITLHTHVAKRNTSP